jgi:hypothetical protein
MTGCRLRPIRSSLLVLILSTLRQVSVKVFSSPVTGLSRLAGAAAVEMAVMIRSSNRSG